MSDVFSGTEKCFGEESVARSMKKDTVKFVLGQAKDKLNFTRKHIDHLRGAVIGAH